MVSFLLGYLGLLRSRFFIYNGLRLTSLPRMEHVISLKACSPQSRQKHTDDDEERPMRLRHTKTIKVRVGKEWHKVSKLLPARVPCSNAVRGWANETKKCHQKTSATKDSLLAGSSEQSGSPEPIAPPELPFEKFPKLPFEAAPEVPGNPEKPLEVPPKQPTVITCDGVGTKLGTADRNKLNDSKIATESVTDLKSPTEVKKNMLKDEKTKTNVFGTKQVIGLIAEKLSKDKKLGFIKPEDERKKIGTKNEFIMVTMDAKKQELECSKAGDETKSIDTDQVHSTKFNPIASEKTKYLIASSSSNNTKAQSNLAESKQQSLRIKATSTKTSNGAELSSIKIDNTAMVKSKKPKAIKGQGIEIKPVKFSSTINKEAKTTTIAESKKKNSSRKGVDEFGTEVSLDEKIESWKFKIGAKISRKNGKSDEEINELYSLEKVIKSWRAKNENKNSCDKKIHDTHVYGESTTGAKFTEYSETGQEDTQNTNLYCPKEPERITHQAKEKPTLATHPSEMPTATKIYAESTAKNKPKKPTLMQYLYEKIMGRRK